MQTTSASNNHFLFLIDRLGGYTLDFFENIACFFYFLRDCMAAFPKIFRNFNLSMEQMSKIGITSLPLVILTSIFTGAVSSYQAAYQFSGYIPLSFLGVAVGKSIMVELGPVLTALVVAGRVGSLIQLLRFVHQRRHCHRT